MMVVVVGGVNVGGEHTRTHTKKHLMILSFLFLGVVACCTLSLYHAIDMFYSCSSAILPRERKLWPERCPPGALYLKLKRQKIKLSGYSAL